MAIYHSNHEPCHHDDDVATLEVEAGLYGSHSNHELCHHDDDVTTMKEESGVFMLAPIEIGMEADMHGYSAALYLSSGTVRVFGRNLHSRMWLVPKPAPLESSRRVTNGIPLGWPLFLPVGTDDVIH
jgi:hypothetical protein